MQVKIFVFSSLGYDNQEIEKSINSWLTENPGVEVKYVNVEILARGPGPGESLIIFVFYEGALGRGKFSATFE